LERADVDDEDDHHEVGGVQVLVQSGEVRDLWETIGDDELERDEHQPRPVTRGGRRYEVREERGGRSSREEDGESLCGVLSWDEEHGEGGEDDGVGDGEHIVDVPLGPTSRTEGALHGGISHPCCE
jgi:hypothetical protein